MSTKWRLKARKFTPDKYTHQTMTKVFSVSHVHTFPMRNLVNNSSIFATASGANATPLNWFVGFRKNGNHIGSQYDITTKFVGMSQKLK